MARCQLVFKALLLFTSCILLLLQSLQFQNADDVAQPPSSNSMDMDKPPKQTKPQSVGSNTSEEDQTLDRIWSSAVESDEKKTGTEVAHSQTNNHKKHHKAKPSKIDATSASGNGIDNGSAATKRKRNDPSMASDGKPKATMPIHKGRNLQASSTRTPPAAKRILNDGFSLSFSFSIDLYDIDLDNLLLQEEEGIQGSSTATSNHVKADDDISQFFDDLLNLHEITTTTTTEGTKKPRFSITAAPAASPQNNPPERFDKRPFVEDKALDRLQQVTTGRRRRLIKVP